MKCFAMLLVCLVICSHKGHSDKECLEGEGEGEGEGEEEEEEGEKNRTLLLRLRCIACRSLKTKTTAVK